MQAKADGQKIGWQLYMNMDRYVRYSFLGRNASLTVITAMSPPARSSTLPSSERSPSGLLRTSPA
jgi:hypothetical protein